jgi:hypothetical protein
MKKHLLLLPAACGFLALLSFKGTPDLPNKLDPMTLKVLDTMHTVTIGWPVEKLEQKVPRVAQFIKFLKENMEQHNWDKILPVCDQGNYMAQKKIGIGDYQYLYELFSMDSTISAGYVGKTKEILEAVKELKVERYNYSNEDGYRSFTFFGTMYFVNGKKKEFTLDITLNKKALWLIGAVG